MRTVSTTTARIVVPNYIFYTRSQYAYVGYSASLTSMAGKDITLDIGVGYDDDGGFATESVITLKRTADTKGRAMFLIGSIAESIINKYGTEAQITLYISDGTSSSQQYAYAIAGYANAEVKYLQDQSSPYSNYPAQSKIVLYPNTSFTQQIFIPSYDEFDVTTEVTETVIASGVKGPFIDITPSKITSEDFGGGLLVDIHGAGRPILVNVVYDTCTKGVFLKWKDKSGITYLYRWTLESTTDESTTEDTYSILQFPWSSGASYKQPQAHGYVKYSQKQTHARRYTLHSRIVETDIYNLCRSIIGCHECYIYDAECADFVPCFVDESEAEDSGAPMQDLEITVVRYEYL